HPPGEHDEFYTDRSIRLPHCFWCYPFVNETPDVNPLPALSSGFVTFGCFNNFAKVTEPALRLWAQILAAAPNSRLLLQCRPGSHRDRVRSIFFDQIGIAPDRLEFIDRVSQDEYFRLHHRTDICLDPFPYPGHTTSLDGLWMGVPMVTLSGN